LFSDDVYHGLTAAGYFMPRLRRSFSARVTQGSFVAIAPLDEQLSDFVRVLGHREPQKLNRESRNSTTLLLTHRSRQQKFLFAEPIRREFSLTAM
jgi:hypothetical protein